MNKSYDFVSSFYKNGVDSPKTDKAFKRLIESITVKAIKQDLDKNTKKKYLKFSESARQLAKKHTKEELKKELERLTKEHDSDSEDIVQHKEAIEIHNCYPKQCKDKSA